MAAVNLAVEAPMLTMLTMNEFCDCVRRSVFRKVAKAAEKVAEDASKIWSEVRKLLWRALGPFPDARDAVAREFEAMVDCDQRE